MQFRATQSTEVKDAKPVLVKAMLYYKPGKSACQSCYFTGQVSIPVSHVILQAR